MVAMERGCQRQPSGSADVTWSAKHLPEARRMNASGARGVTFRGRKLFGSVNEKRGVDGRSLNKMATRRRRSRVKGRAYKVCAARVMWFVFVFVHGPRESDCVVLVHALCVLLIKAFIDSNSNVLLRIKDF